MVFVKYLVFGLHFLVSVSLIVLVTMQTSKHEGLASSIGGGGGGGSYRGRPGMEEQLARYTGFLATAFMFLSLLVWMLVEKFRL